MICVQLILLKFKDNQSLEIYNIISINDKIKHFYQTGNPVFPSGLTLCTVACGLPGWTCPTPQL